jgi:ABC-type amino acid transport substrate-binding protein
MCDQARHAADAVIAEVSSYAEEIAERCDEAQASAGDMRGACDDTSRAVAGLVQVMEQSRAGIGASKQASDEATSTRLERMLEVGGEIRVSADRVEQLSQSLERLTAFVDAIMRIADQTKLLSLNARIEAARAGQHGATFAVVAEQVRELAQDAAREADRVAQEIASLTGEAAGTVQEIVRSVGGLDELKRELDGLRLEQGEVWDGVGEQLGRTASRLEDLQTAMQQQVTTAERTSDDVDVIRKVAARLGEVRADRIDLAAGGAPRERRPLLDEVRERGVLRIGAWTGFRGLNFINPRTRRKEGMELDFVEHIAKRLGVRAEVYDFPWVDLPKRLRRRDFDLLFCALIPDPSYRGVSYSRSYLDMGLVLMRRAGDTSIERIEDLAGKVVGHIADPAAKQALEATGVEFGELRPVYDDDYYDPVVAGTYDAFVIDLPIVHWCASSPDSPWHGKVEVVGEPFTRWIYSAVTRSDDASRTLLAEVDEVIGGLRVSPEYRRIVERWQGRAYDWGKRPEDFLVAIPE